jgi:hypothetical protein
VIDGLKTHQLLKISYFMPTNLLNFRPTSLVNCLSACAAFVMLSACGGGSSDNLTDTISTVTYTSVLSGTNEVPAVITGAAGSGTATLTLPSRALSGSIQITGMVANAAHIHEAASGSNGPVIVALVDQGSGKWAVPANTFLTESQASKFSTNGLYFNVHSINNPTGEIRGQISTLMKSGY